ncbi:TonB-dependent receptor plug domain-containing protein [Pleionea mediterranea]|uniref:TonB-dependent receptor-like protein n=1 Tax=Pleionea mediterranea TaxID=523701 RepID=A0A316FVT9_9GAMM|nr:TonB-dependent receptor plug domain-containing protein [Pleionea mediterranea]PWK51720.1 TonB-dependent receptor-like protein [Pleionea mediterranea]
MLVNKTNAIYRAVCLALLGGSVSASVNAAEQEQAKNEALEEVVVEGSRLQGTAQAVLEERKAQAFVADIMGSEQISRTGDSDAASALRRVTGLTLVDGKFIYVRGLGERYSSTQLNGMNVPSPDPTRSVMPLDLFPASIIESLNVQKSFSPDMPAHFGGGNVNIRTKSIPQESVFKLKLEGGLNSNKSSSPWYEGGSSSRDAFGTDDGTRALPAALRSRLNGEGIDGLAADEASELFGRFNRNINADYQSVDPNYGLGLTLGNSFDVGNESRFGFLATTAYKNKWYVTNERNVNNLAKSGGDIRINEFADGHSTEHKVSVSSMINFGFEYGYNHKLEFNNIYLRDTKDRIRDRQFESTNTINEPEEERRKVDILYEERELYSQQLKGMHTFNEFNNLGVDWYYSDNRSMREAPGGFEATYRVDLIDTGSGIRREEQIARDTNVVYGWQTLRDDGESYGFNLSLPFSGSNYAMTLKAGGDFYSKERRAEAITVELETFSIPNQFLQGSNYGQIFSDATLNDAAFDIDFEDATANGDKYAAATLLDAAYVMADYEMGRHWRFTGGFRWEDFRQLSIPFQKHSNFFAVENEEIADLVFEEDDLFASLAATYVVDDETQWRFNYSQTAIRPDLRDISTTFYIDPLTEFLVRGSTSLESSSIDNFDVRWEWYMPTGENLSVAFFLKDIDKPIEQIELPSATEGAPQLLTANAKSGELIGVEVEFLKDLSFLGDDYANFFVNGNFTFSDSEVDIGLDDAGDSLFEQQLAEALNTQQSVTEVITNNKRRLIGHSEWVVNLQLGWDSLDNNHSATLVYNVFGPRIIIPGVNGFSDGEEKSFNSLDMVYTWYATYDSTVKVRLKNILDEEKEIEQEGVTILRENPGTEFNISFTTNF